MADLTTIKSWFQAGDKPTEEHFATTFDSFRHKDDMIQLVDVEGIDSLLGLKADDAVFEGHKIDPTAHQTEFDTKVDKEVGKGLSTNDFTNAHLSKLNSINSIEKVDVSRALLPTDEGKLLNVTTNINLSLDSTHTLPEGWSCNLRYGINATGGIQLTNVIVEGGTVSSDLIPFTAEEIAYLFVLDGELIIMKS